MAISKVYSKNEITIYCADVKSVFKPYPVKDELLESAKEEKFVLNAGIKGKTPFQII